MNNGIGTLSNNLHIEVSPKIENGDFDVKTTMTNAASRIASDLKFEQYLKHLYEGKMKKQSGKTIVQK